MMDLVSQFDLVLAQYLTSHESVFADHQSLAQYFNTPLERQVFLMALGDIVELDRYPELSQEIRNRVCMVTCNVGEHSPTVLFIFI